MTEERPLCECHGAPMHFRRDSRYRIGGFYTCRVNDNEKCRAHYAANGEAIRQQARDRYDTDPTYRIGKRLRDDRRQRLLRLERRRARLTEEG